MGRDNKQGRSHNKGTLPQTPKNQKIAPGKVQEEFAQELTDLKKLAFKAPPKN